MKTFTRDYLVNELGLPYNSDCVIEDTIINADKWGVTHRLIFKDNDVTYRTYYEEKDEMLLWDDEVECEEVFPIEVKEIVWVSPDDITMEGSPMMLHMKKGE